MEPTGQMKIGVIGAGAVGSACLLSSILRGIAREIVVVNRDRKRAKAVVTELLESNVAIYRQILPEIIRDVADAVILVVTDPPDPRWCPRAYRCSSAAHSY